MAFYFLPSFPYATCIDRWFRLDAAKRIDGADFIHELTNMKGLIKTQAGGVGYTLTMALDRSPGRWRPYGRSEG